MGTVNPLGHDVETMWAAMLAGKSGIRPIELFDASTFPSIPATTMGLNIMANAHRIGSAAAGL